MRRRRVNVRLTEAEYWVLVGMAEELSVRETRSVSVSEVLRRAAAAYLVEPDLQTLLDRGAIE